MNKHLKISIALLASIFGLAACGQKNSADSTAQTTQTVQETTTAPTTQANVKQSSDNKHSSARSNEQNSSNLPKDGEATYKKEGKGKTTTLQYFFKDNIVYKQIGIYTYIPKESGKSEEEIVQNLNQSQELYKDVTGITSIVEKKDGQYIQTVTFDYQTIDWKELNRRAPKRFPATKPGPLKFSESAATLLKNGFVKQ